MSSDCVVRVESGILRGRRCKNETDSKEEYFSFQGIPYAKPPIGELRFKAPQPVEPWSGIKDAKDDGPECFQSSSENETQKAGSEDCLTLNTYTTKFPIISESDVSYDLKPVMVYIHGGAFTEGSNSKLIFGPEFLIREDVVLVTINYRLGLLGFLSLQDGSLEVPGNAGFRDMVMALKWVKSNIKNFNGDPNNVTLFGHSAGGAAVNQLMLSPLAKGLFHKAIAQSGTALCPWAACAKVAPVLADILGVDQDDEKKLLDQLRCMPVEELHTLQQKFTGKCNVSVKEPVGWIIEDASQVEEPFLVKNPEEVMQSGKYNQVPLMLGYTSREGMIIHKRTSIEKLLTDIDQTVPDTLGIQKGTSLSQQLAKKIMKFYFNDEDPMKANVDLYYKLQSDNFFIRDTYRAAMLHSKTSSKPVFLYKVTLDTSIAFLKGKLEITDPGVCHADELSYLFKMMCNEKITPNTPEDIGIRRFCRLWTNFAKYGNPNPPGNDPLLLVPWKPFTQEEKNYLEIGKNIFSKTDPEDDRMKFWEEIYNRSS